MKTKKIIMFFLAIGTYFSGNAQTWSTGAGLLYTNPASTKVGIGTVNPQSPLHIASTSYESIILERADEHKGPAIWFGPGLVPSYGYALGSIDFKGKTSSNIFSNGCGITAFPEVNWTSSNQSSQLRFYNVNGTTLNYNMIIKANGAVLIGTSTQDGTSLLTVNGGISATGPVKIGASTLTTPAGYKLYVESGILTEKVKVAVKTSSDWSDYVFAKDYKLKSLQEVESFISKNKHLPGVPSASEMVEDGLDVAKSDALLLQKIEELTLYMIQQQKEIETLKSLIK